MKQETAYAVALGLLQTEQDVKNMLYIAARENSTTWSLQQKASGETWSIPRVLQSRIHRPATPTEKKEILAAYEKIQAVLEVAGVEA